MSTYEKLDDQIVSRIAGGGTRFAQIEGGEVSVEAYRLAELLDREAFRIIDARLQALKRKGCIAWSRASGWTKVTK